MRPRFRGWQNDPRGATPSPPLFGITGRRSSRVQQGGHLRQLLFAPAIQALLQELVGADKKLEAVAYLDDVIIAGKQFCAKFRPSVKPSTCQLVPPGASSEVNAASFHGSKLSSTRTFDVMGLLVGDEQHCSNSAKALESAAHLGNAHAAYKIILTCLGSCQVRYAMRTTCLGPRGP
jgi:hypothetical protein